MKCSNTLCIRLPMELMSKLDELGRDKAEFVRNCIANALLDREDKVELLSKELTELESKKNEIAKKIEDEENSKKQFYEMNKPLADKYYTKIYKQAEESYLKYSTFLSNEEITNLLLQFKKLTGISTKDCWDNIQKEIIKKYEVKNGMDRT